ncbi:MAG: rRNA maturation RNase YbeY [Verrucomicrobium sp.]|nr:rRNA maturation RNase YbeY [Verrucomicrobium sp.]
MATKSLALRLRASLELIPPPRRAGRPLPSRIEVNLLSAEESGRIHAEFLDDPAPTDVITFDHGEILICPRVAREQGKAYGRTMEEEVLLYGIHGLLHLRGWDDATPAQYKAMAEAQEEVWKRVKKKAAPKRRKA